MCVWIFFSLSVSFYLFISLVFRRVPHVAEAAAAAISAIFISLLLYILNIRDTPTHHICAYTRTYTHKYIRIS